MVVVFITVSLTVTVTSVDTGKPMAWKYVWQLYDDYYMYRSLRATSYRKPKLNCMKSGWHQTLCNRIPVDKTL